MTQQNNYQTIKDLKGYLSIDRIDEIIQAASNLRDKTLIRLLSRSGRRVTEIVGRKRYVHRNANYIGKRGKIGLVKSYPKIQAVRPVDINWEEGLIAFPILKKRTKMRKLKVIDDETLKMLDEYIQEYRIAPNAALFPITRYRVNQIFVQCCEACGIYYIGEKRPHPHHLRHSYAIHVLKNSKNPADLKKLSMLLEHNSIEVTSGYLQFAQEDMRDLINEAFKPRNKQPKNN